MWNNQSTFNVANATTQFGQVLPQGRRILNEATASEFLLTAPASATDTLTTATTSPLGWGGWAVDSVNWQTGTVVLDTDDISEWTTNLYYTETRVSANSAVAANTAKVSYPWATASETLENKDLTSATNTFPTFNQDTTGTAANVTGTVAIANGGTGATTASAALTALWAEANLWNPSSDGQILSSTTAWVRSWIDSPSWGGWGFNFIYPHDVTSWFEVINDDIWVSPWYTVPTWKVLYITQVSSSWTNSPVRVWWTIVWFWVYVNASSYINLWLPVIVEEWEEIDTNANNLKMYWFLCDSNSNIEPMYSTTSYTVPTGKIYVITHIYKVWNTSINIWDTTWSFNNWVMTNQATDISMNVLHQPIILSEWQVFNSWSISNVHHLWYLIPDNFNV